MSKKLFLFCSAAEDGIHAGAAFGADPFHRLAAVFHGHLLGIRHLALVLAFDAVGHDFFFFRHTFIETTLTC